MRKFGLIGFPLMHSFSKKYFSEKFEKEGLTDCQYDLFEIDEIGKIKEVLEAHSGLVGLNVTIPYKEQVVPYLDEMESGCRAIGAVNTIKVADGRLIGYNTDYIGFRTSLSAWIRDEPFKALVLGSGGASRAVTQALNDLGILFKVVTRNKGGDEKKIDYQELAQNKTILEEHHLLINTTPLGTFPAVDEMPEVPEGWLSDQHRVYDLVYNPEKTALMKAVEEKGGLAKNGLEMLHLQAEASWEIWNQTLK